MKQDKINLAAVQGEKSTENGGGDGERKDWILKAAGRALERVLHYSDQGVGMGEIFRVRRRVWLGRAREEKERERWGRRRKDKA